MAKVNEQERWIKPLPERVINKIAAGEVIERPAAVVKELVENSIDADSTRIEIEIEKAGAKLIKISDNGCGIPEEQIEIAFSRHATSKIRNFDDLNSLFTYGFRGEALPSIASISRLRMVSRSSSSPSGTEIIYEGGVLQSKKPLAASPGTTIEIENLFYNTPVRRKFMKAETTESRHIARTAMAMALSRPDIGFKFISNGRSVFDLPPDSSLEERIRGVLGREKKLVKLSGETEILRVNGMIGTPQEIQQNRFGQFIFINNRYIQSQTISHAFMAGYGELLPRGKFPVGVLLVEVNLEDVDVNVHPTKAEVRLSREREIHSAIYHIVKDNLQKDGIVPIFHSHKNNTVDQNKFSSDLQNRAVIQGMRPEKVYNQDMMEKLYNSPEIATSGNQEIVSVDRSTGEIVETSTESKPEIDNEITFSSGFRYIGRFSDLYLLVQTGEELYIVDQHTAHERVLFEHNMKRVDKNEIEAQAMLFPVQVELSPEQFTVFEEALEVLNNSGFNISEFGGRTVNIEAIPAIMKRKAPEKIFLNVLDDIASLKKSGYDLKKAIAETVACRSAVMSGDRLNEQEAVGLLKQLLQCENKYSCPHGRPTFIKITKEDLDKQFGRC